jgi:fumarate reductase flavoprotein subunit
LKVDSRARVLRPDGLPIVGLYAGSGTAVVISGKAYKGYSSGNGLLATTVLGEVSGEAVAEELAGDARRAYASGRFVVHRRLVLYLFSRAGSG